MPRFIRAVTRAAVSAVFENGLYVSYARRAGYTVRSAVDCLIAACALRHGLTVAHHDRGFDAIAEVTSLHVRNVSV